MHSDQKIILAICSGALACLPLLGCEGGSQAASDEIDQPALVGIQPNTQPPKVVFPATCQQEDRSFNDFVAHVLDICHRGDYDPFCGLFGISDIPPSYDEFKRIWGGVGKITVRNIIRDDQPSRNNLPAEYYVHAIVQLREPDAQKRTSRHVVVRVFKESGEWRISGAPKEVRRKILIADSQAAPASPEDGHLSGPVDSAAPDSRPAVYK